MELPYRLRVRNYWLFSVYTIEYNGDSVRKWRGNDYQMMKDMVFLMNTAYAEGLGAYIINGQLKFPEDFL